MDQKIIITSGDVNRVLDNCETRNALGEIGIDITWCGYNVAIKRFISFTDMLSFVDGVVSGCFAKSDNRYLPEVRDLFFRCSLVEFYTNIVLPESVEEKNQIVYGTDIIDLILQNIDRGQFRAIMDGIEKRVTYLVNTDMKRIEDDPNNKDLIERRDDLLASQRDSILAAKQEKEAMIDLAMNGIQVELDAIRELIDAYTESLDSAKDLYDYQKRIAEKTANISALEKQLAAYQNDMSEETRSKIQKIQLELKDAKDDLKDTEYDRFVSDAKDALDSMYDEYEDLLNNRFDDVDALFEKLIDTVNENYNALIEKYSVFTSDYKKAVKSIVGYPELMERYFDTIDFGIYLTSKLMPAPEMIETSATDQIRIIRDALLSPVSVKNIETCSASTAESAVLGMAKAVADSRYQIRISESAYADKTWSGIIQVTNTSNEEDTATSARLSCKVNDDYAGYVKQKILKTMKRSTDDATSIDAMFKLSDEKFAPELRKYCLSRLNAFHDICQSCVDILIEHGISDNSKWAYKDDDLYQSLYLPYYNKLQLLETEIQLREQEIAIVTGSYDTSGNLTADGMKSFLQSEKDTIQKNLNFDDYLGEEYLLGMSQSDIDKDYELTTFHTGSGTDANARRRNETDWTKLINAINAVSGDSFRDKCVHFAVGTCGITMADINAYRAAMINGTPETLHWYQPISKNLTGCTISNAASQVDYGEAYTATITPGSGKPWTALLLRWTVWISHPRQSLASLSAFQLPLLAVSLMVEQPC